MTDENLLTDDLDVEPEQPRADFADALQALRDYETGKDVVTLSYGLSGLITDQLAELAPVWNQMHAESRQRIMRMLAEMGETDFMLDFGAMGHFGLGDPDPAVRKAAIEVLWMDESPEFMRRLMDLAQADPAIEVRASAVSELGRFILLGELEDLPREDTIAAQEVAIRLWNDREDTINVRRRALEALANCGHPIVPEAIREAYDSPDQPMRVSAIYAMGRSYDDRWSDIILAEITSEDQELRYEAARAAGSLELLEAVPTLAKLTVEDDRELLEVAVWSLGEIGGREALRILNLLVEKAEEENDVALADAIDDAISNATLMNDLGL
jgi:hypothetical protein